MTAITRAVTRMIASAIRKIRTLSRKARARSGNEPVKRSGLKKARLTSGHPGELTTTTAITATKTAVLAAAIARLRPPPSPRIRERRPAAPLEGALLEDGGVGLIGEPLLLDLREPAAVLQPGEGGVDAVDERAALLERHREELLLADGRELADDRAVLELDGGDEERGRQVDDDTVDLLGLHRRDRVVERVVDRRLVVRLDVVDDVLVARRPDRRAELRALQVGDALCVRDLVGLQRDESLVDVVVRVAEVDRLRALVRVGDLVDVEVEVLGPRAEGLVERDDRPVHLVLREPELLGDGVGDGALEALARRRIVQLPRRAGGRAALEPRREGRVVGADREPPGRLG